MIEVKHTDQPTKFEQWKADHPGMPYYILLPEDMQAFVQHKLCTTDLMVLTLINASDGAGECHFKNDQFAKLLGKSYSTIRDSLSRLYHLGLVHSKRKDGRRYLMATKFDPYREENLQGAETAGHEE